MAGTLFSFPSSSAVDNNDIMAGRLGITGLSSAEHFSAISLRFSSERKSTGSSSFTGHPP